MNWNQIVTKVIPYIVKIETPRGSGTGFLCMYSEDKSLCGIATALHVVDYALDWQQPIKIVHYSSNTTKLLKELDRFIVPDWNTDSAVILFPKSDFPFPEELINLLPIETPISIGHDVGWVGFPAIDPFTLCFFSGNISARRDDRRAYLIDGVAINGVSGGPVIYSPNDDTIQIIGIVSAYRANRLGGDTLPGLSIAQDVSHFHKVIKDIRSLDEGRKKQQEISDASKEVQAINKNG